MKTVFKSRMMDIVSKDFIEFIGNSDVSGQTIRSYSQDKYPSDFFKHDDIEYAFNSNGFRCDEFSIEQSSNNFLFAGCSQSLVLGLPQELGWANIINTKLGKKNFYNLALVQSSAEIIIYNTIQYVYLFGKPQAIFILFPDFYRKMYVKDDYIFASHNILSKDEKNTDATNESFIRYFMLLKQLESFCDLNNIPLLYSSWQRISVEAMMHLKNKGVLKYCFDVSDINDIDIKEISKSNSKYKHYWDVARDNVHFGEFDNICFANSFLKQWETREQH